MNFEKIILDQIPRCYCTGYATVDGALTLLLASEAEGGVCRAYSGPDFSRRETVWDGPGGTMSIVEIPGKPGEFLAVQNFFPGFQAEAAKIVWCRRDSEHGWIVKDYIKLPYVHRFDLIEAGGVTWFIGCALCSSKKEREDWSDPGKVYVGKLTGSPDEQVTLSVIAEGLTKNHGYSRAVIDGRTVGLVASENGVIAAIPPEHPDGEWTVRKLLDIPVSDVAMFDLNGDGTDELLTIEPFHGNKVRIYELRETGYKQAYELAHPIDFAHAIWTGKLRGEACALIGIRKMGCELFKINFSDGKYGSDIIEAGGGPSNVAVANGDACDYIICANHTKAEAAVYIVKEA